MQAAAQAPTDRKWTLLKELSGATGRVKTEKFTTTAEDWRVSWKTLEGDPDPIGSVTIAVRDDAGRLVTEASNLGQKVTSGSFNVRSRPGPHYLEIEGADRKWHVAVEQ